MSGREEMNCESHRKLLESYVPGERDPGLEARLSAHEQTCTACAGERQALLRVVDRLNSLRDARLDEPAFEEAAAQVLQETARGGEPRMAVHRVRRDFAPRRSPAAPSKAGWVAAGLVVAITAIFVASGALKKTSPGQGRSLTQAPADAQGPLDPEAAPLPAIIDEQLKLIRSLPPPAPEAPRPKAPEPAAPPAVAPEAPKPPAPAPAPEEKAAVAVARTREADSPIARFELIQGNVTTSTDGTTGKPEVGNVLLPGQRVQTRGRGSAAVLQNPDGARIALGPDTAVSGTVSEDRAVFVSRGVVTVEIRKGALSATTLLATTQSRVEILQGRATLSAAGESTRIDVAEGRVRVTRILDGASADVKAGYYAVVAPRLPLQAKPQDKPAQVDQSKIDAAIRNGISYLKKRANWGVDRAARKDELVLLTYVHADLPQSDPAFQKLFNAMMESPLEKTYSVVLQAMILEEVQRVKHQARIAQCAQFLLDNLCRNGQWSYGEPTVFTLQIAPVVASGREAREFLDPGEKPKVVRKIPVKKQREGPEAGDNSNTQYAALGLRACHDAGIVLPKELVRLARQWWVVSQHDTGDGKDPYAGQGWSYRQKGDFHPYGSMTAGAVGGVVIYDYILDEPWKTDKVVIRGMEWMTRNFTVTENPGPPEPHGGGLNHYYYLYALERMGILYGTEKLGADEWYPKGAHYLLGAQKADGSWEVDDPVTDTCFAILFLRRATRPIASQDRKPK